jgi:NADH-quinone oxidoreductase subunit F
MTLNQIVEEIGGGIPDGRKLKAVLVGGPSGGCVPAHLCDTPVDYEALKEVGTIMGSGGLVVLDDSDCMVDIARYFMSFTQEESCGKCTHCRIGTKRMLEIMDRLCEGKGRKGDMQKLEMLSGITVEGSLCGLGKTAPIPCCPPCTSSKRSTRPTSRASVPHSSANRSFNTKSSNPVSGVPAVRRTARPTPFP